MDIKQMTFNKQWRFNKWLSTNNEDL